MQIFISSISLMISMMFLTMNHPLAMGLTLLMQTVVICLITGMIAKTFWFSYILFLVFLGGMLVLFIYMTSLASNEMFSFSSTHLFMTFILIGVSLLMSLLLDKYLWTNSFMNFDMQTMSLMLNDNNLINNLTKLYNFPTSKITLLLVNYLFLTLIAVVKITNIFYGPLRQKN
uniref:NADH-ubiquinone oxidoreductase chain 6 n=1 Tax=Bittacus pilicornis TaxID=172808 RepID=E9NQ56_BITPI|nr:NADH dehydrogenase subunit 6 [Bittacus pilicornis]ADW83145.1 NADH dehydrogenase subunit 6 [Bittacus pilicornis]